MEVEKKLPKMNWKKRNLKIWKLTRNEKILLTLLFIILFLWGIYRFIIIIQAEKLEALNEKRIEYQGKINAMNSILKKEKEISREWDLLYNEKEKIVSKYFPTIDQAQIIYLLNDLVTHEDLSIVDLNFNRPSFEDVGELQVKNMDISIPYNGGYEGVLGVVNSIRKSPRKILIDSLYIDRNQEGMLSGNMSLKFYSLEGIEEIESEIIYIDTTLKGNKTTPFVKYDDYIVSKDFEESFSNDNDSVNLDLDKTNLTVDSDKTYLTLDSETDRIKVNPYIKKVLLDFESENNYFIPSQPLVKGNIMQSNNSKSKEYSLRFEYDILAIEEENRAYIDVSKNNIILNHPPNSIGMWLYSYDYSPITVGVGYKGQMGEEEFCSLTEGISWTGWKYVESTPPTDLNIYPLKLDKIYVEMPKDRQDFGVILMDKLEALYNRNIGEDGSENSIENYIFHVVKTGDNIENISIAYYGTDNYKNEILRLNEMKAGDILTLGKVLVLKKP